MPKHTCGYLLQLRLIHSILHQATQGFANCVKFAIKLVCVWERKRGVCLCVYFVCMHTETHGDKFRHTHTHITTHKLQSVDVGKWYGLFHFGTAFEVSDCSPGLLSFKRILQHLKKWETNPEECLTLHYADGFYKTLTNWTPAVLHIFVMDNGRLSQSVPSPPLAWKRRAGISYLSRKKLLAYSAQS